MSKSVYIEVGRKCYSMCVTCDVNSVPRSNDYMTEERLNKILLKLHVLGYKKIRFTGYDPISCRFLVPVMNKFQSNPYTMSFKILTTLLRYNKSVEVCDNIMISLSAVEEYYEEYFSVNHWDKFKRNFTILADYRKDIVINCTISKALSTHKSLIKLVMFLNEHKASIKFVQFFNAMGKSSIDVDVFMFRRCLNYLHIPFELELDSHGSKQNKCIVAKETMYIKENGDIYPCCMAGGEIGQNLLKELKITNILRDERYLPQMLSNPITSLSNNICDHCTPKYLKLNKKLFKEIANET